MKKVVLSLVTLLSATLFCTAVQKYGTAKKLNVELEPKSNLLLDAETGAVILK